MAAQNAQVITLSLSDSCDMYADKAKLQQVVYNLMENAVKYTPANGWIKVGLQRVGRDAVLTVSDSGPGIPRDSLPHVFERFYRVDKARGRESGGTGLGLSIVQQYVNLHGGNVKVASEEGQGAVFTVELPLNKG
jgi:signal transduction histidine kinase